MKNIMNLIKMKLIVQTRGIRYKDSYHNLLLKNSIRIPIKPNSKPNYQTFTVLWNEDMTSYTLKSTTNYNSSKSYLN